MFRRAFLPALLVSMVCADAAALEVRVATLAGKALPDAAVVLEPLTPGPSSRNRTHTTAHAVIEQRGAEFAPYVTVVQTGTAVDFPNNDTVRHHVYSFSQPKRFEIKLYAGKPGQPITFDK